MEPTWLNEQGLFSSGADQQAGRVGANLLFPSPGTGIACMQGLGPFKGLCPLHGERLQGQKNPPKTELPVTVLASDMEQRLPLEAFPLRLCLHM